MARFHSDMAALEMRPPVAEPRATESIDAIIDLVGRLLESGHAYLTARHRVLRRVDVPRFGELSHYSEEQMVRLARARGGNPDDPHRRAPLDFVLWQPSLADEPAWRAPFGVGRPGWHIECSAMAMHEHGPTLDLHGGGTDLIFPHHECEIAQSEVAHRRAVRRRTGCTRRWSTTRARRCRSRSATSCSSSDLLKIADPRAIRLALMRHHYRHGFEWYDTDLEEGTALLHRLLAAAERRPVPIPRRSRERVRDAIDDDLDAPRALDALDDLASAILSGGDDPTAPDRAVRARRAARRRPRTARSRRADRRRPRRANSAVAARGALVASHAFRYAVRRERQS